MSHFYLLNFLFQDTYSEMEAFWCKELNANTKKIKLYTSIWARLGFTASHLVGKAFNIMFYQFLFYVAVS